VAGSRYRDAMHRVGILGLIGPFFCLAVIVAVVIAVVALVVIRHSNRKSQ
jgi:hypothetical protein